MTGQSTGTLACQPWATDNSSNRGRGRGREQQRGHLAGVPPLPYPVYRCQEAVLGNDKLSMAIGGRGQLHIEGAALQGRAGVTQLQRQPATCVAGSIVADDIGEGYHMGRLHLPHALAPAFSLQAVALHGIHQLWLPCWFVD